MRRRHATSPDLRDAPPYVAGPPWGTYAPGWDWPIAGVRWHWPHTSYELDRLSRRSGPMIPHPRARIT